MSGSQAIDAPRGSTFKPYPEDLFIITDPKHPRYDRRVELPLDEGLFASVHSTGVIEPVVAWKDGDRIEVLDGRQRVRAAIKSNQLRRKSGTELLRVEVVLRKVSDDAIAVAIKNQANIRVPDSILSKAESVQHDMEVLGKSESQAAHERGVGVATVKQWLKLLDCTKKVKAAVDEGRITLTLAVTQIAKLKRDEQDAALAKLVEHRGTAARGEKPKPANKNGKTKTGRPSIQTIKKLAEYKFDDAGLISGEARAVLDYVVGAIDQSVFVARIPALAPAFAARTEATE